MDAKLKFQGVEKLEERDGIIISCGKTGRALVINGVRGIDDGAFSGQNNLKNVRIGQDIEYIGKSCFANCPNLEDIMIYKKLSQYADRLRSGNKARIIIKDA